MNASLLPLVLAGLPFAADPACPPAGARPAPPEDLIELLPADTAAFASWRSGAATAALEQRFLEVADAFTAAELDRFALDVMDVAGAPPNLVAELRSVRNVLVSVGSVVPWRELLGEEVVYAETRFASLLPGTEMPGVLLATRPAPGMARDVEDSLAGFLGAVAGTVAFLRYDIHGLPGDALRRYELVLRGGERDRAVLQVAAGRGVLLVGMGQAYFDLAVERLMGGPAEGLVDAERFQRAFEDLDAGADGRSYVDVTALVEDLDELQAVLAPRAFNAGLWQGVLNGALDVADTLETVATVARCEGTELVTETMTRFDPASPAWARAGLAETSRSDLLAFVPAGVSSFEMRGPVDLPAVYRWGLERWQADWAPAQDVVWVGDIVQAVLGLSLDDDLLPWLGSEHVSMQVPAGDGGGGTETVFLSRPVSDAGARKCLERAVGIFEAVAPRAVGRLQELLIEAQVPFAFDVQLAPGPREHPGLHRLHVMAAPVLMKQMVFGLREGYFVFATSETALETCFRVAAGEAPGLEARPLAAGLLERRELTSAGLAPMGAGVTQALTLLEMGIGMLEGSASSMESEAGGEPGAQDHDAQLAVHMALDLLARVQAVVEELDFLGDAVSYGEARDGGLARYETSTLHLRLPAPPAAPERSTPLADATESTPW